jgi:hypothetical protein
MSVSQFRRRFVAGIIICLGLAFLIGRFKGFEPRWGELKDGMTQVEVMRVLGAPAWAGNGSCTGAGDKKVARWEYRRWQLGRSVYYFVDFDYIGPGGAPVVFRTERVAEEWMGPLSWLGRAKCRG